MTLYTISPSGLEMYESCPYCFYLRYTGHKQETTEAMRFGTRLHNMLKNYHREVYPDIDEDLAPFLSEYEKIYDPEYQVVEDEWMTPLFDTGINLKMRVDLVKDDLLIEHKTSARPYSQQFVDKHRQLTAYSWAWRQLYSEPETAIRVNVFNTAQNAERLLDIFETRRTEDDFLEWKDWVLQILAAIAQDEFEPNEAGKFHNYPECPFYKS